MAMTKTWKAVLLAACLALGAGEAMAEFPAEYVRLNRTRENTPHPQLYYQQNRVLLRSVQLEQEGDGVRVSGSLFTDFEVTDPPADLKLERGQIIGLKVTVSLHAGELLLEKDNGVVIQKSLKKGDVVPGQSVTVVVGEIRDGFGFAEFQLPALAKPLPPGVYYLSAVLNFQNQPADKRAAIKWCRDLFGEWSTPAWDDAEFRKGNLVEKRDKYGKVVLADRGHIFDSAPPVMSREEEERRMLPETGGSADFARRENEKLRKANDAERARTPEQRRSDYHEAIWKELLTGVREMTAESRIHVGQTLTRSGSRVSLRLTDKNVVCTDSFFVMLGEQLDRQKQLDWVAVERKRLKDDENIAADIRVQNLLNLEWMEIAIQYDIQLYRGDPKKKDLGLGREFKDYESQLARQFAILEQIKEWEDVLHMQYWVAIEGILAYDGWKPMYKAGYNAYNACLKSDNVADSDERIRKLEAWAANEQAKKERDDKRIKAMEKFPEEIRRLYFDYLYRVEETDEFDSAKFTKKVSGAVQLDPKKWSTFRDKFIARLNKAMESVLDDVDTSRYYAFRVWPSACEGLIQARDMTIAVAYTWEHYTRTSVHKEEAQVILDEWAEEARNDPSRKAYHAAAQVTPNNILSQYETALDIARKDSNLDRFKYERK